MKQIKKLLFLLMQKKSVQENAQVYYENYKKAVSGLQELEYDIQKAKKELLIL